MWCYDLIIKSLRIILTSTHHYGTVYFYIFSLHCRLAQTRNAPTASSATSGAPISPYRDAAVPEHPRWIIASILWP